MNVSFTRAALHLGALWTLAVAWPLLDLLGDSAAFFVARGSTAADILVLALGWTLVPPLLLAAGVAGLHRLRPALGGAAHVVACAVLVALLALPPLGHLLSGSAAAVVVALAAGAVAAAAFARAAPVRSLVTALSPAPVVCLVLFLAVSPVSELVFSRSGASAVAGPSRSSTPIVHVILDEFPLATLTDRRGRIDADAFPNLAKLAREATWYRNATAVSDRTVEAVPPRLTGRMPQWNAPPTARSHPRSMFTLFSRSHELHVVEPITDICPRSLCDERRPPALDRLRALADDLAVVEGHLLLPADLRGGIPPIGDAWGGFGESGFTEGGFETTRDRGQRDHMVGTRLAASRRRNGFEDVAARLERPSRRPPLVFVHSPLPHAPWQRLPDGRQYVLHRADYPARDELWPAKTWIADASFQRHLLQAQLADAQVGVLLDRLRETGLWDRTVVVVASDHGAAFRGGVRRRRAGTDTLADLAAVPLLVKYPGQRTGVVDDGAVRTIDVLPTIAKAAGVRVPWRIDGRPADERPVDPLTLVGVLNGSSGRVVRGPLRTVVAQRRARDAYEARLLARGVFAIGPRPDLLGARVARPAEAPRGRATVDGLNDYATLRPGTRMLPALVSGAVTGLRAGEVLAVALNDRVEATTHVRARGPGRGLEYEALVPPDMLRTDGPNDIDVLVVRDGGLLRIGGTPGPAADD